MAQTIETLDLRSLSHADRLPTILGKWQSLPVGQTFRLVVEHDPMPLQFLLRGESPGEFDWRYDEKGPEKWVIGITRVAAAKKASGEDSDREKLKNLLARLHSGADVAQVKEQAKDLLRNMDAQKLGLLEQEMIQEGLGQQEMRRLCDAHLEIMRETLDTAQVTPPLGHPIRTMMDEHEVLKSNLRDLDRTLQTLKQGHSFAQGAREIEEVKRIARVLLDAEPHHHREEEVIFPELVKRGVTEPPQIMLQEHTDLRAKKALLRQTAAETQGRAYQEWLRALDDVGSYLVEELTNHIYKEDNILYQMALQVIEPEAWADIKRRCDRIGYCSFTPEAAVAAS